MSASHLFPCCEHILRPAGHTILDKPHQTKEGKAKTKVNFYADLIIPLSWRHSALCLFCRYILSLILSSTEKANKPETAKVCGAVIEKNILFFFPRNDIHSKVAAHSRTLAPQEAPSCD